MLADLHSDHEHKKIVQDNVDQKRRGVLSCTCVPHCIAGPCFTWEINQSQSVCLLQLCACATICAFNFGLVINVAIIQSDVWCCSFVAHCCPLQCCCLCRCRAAGPTHWCSCGGLGLPLHLQVRLLVLVTRVVSIICGHLHCRTAPAVSRVSR